MLLKALENPKRRENQVEFGDVAFAVIGGECRISAQQLARAFRVGDLILAFIGT